MLSNTSRMIYSLGSATRDAVLFPIAIFREMEEGARVPYCKEEHDTNGYGRGTSAVGREVKDLKGRVAAASRRGTTPRLLTR